MNGSSDTTGETPSGETQASAAQPGAAQSSETESNGSVPQTDPPLGVSISVAAEVPPHSGSAALTEVVLKPRRAQPFYGRHPWVFAGAIARVTTSDGREPAAGEVVRLVTSDRRFVAYGLLNPVSRIQVRLYSWDESSPVDAELIHRLVERAVTARRRLFDLKSEATGCRLIFSESDGLSGLVVDFYGGYLLVQFTSLGLYRLRDAVIEALMREVTPRGIWLRTEKGMREAEGLEVADGLIAGKEPPRPLFIEEHGIQYGVDVQQGQKTGFFLDQRLNRLAVSRYVRGDRVLDAFCYAGGFGITALVKGAAAHVTGIDSSESALRLAAANAELNSVADRCRWVRGDVRDVISEMAAQGIVFDTVVIDPPRMARTRSGVDRAVKGYTNLNLTALTVLKPGGTLVTCSCSGLVSRSQFQEMLADVARQSGRDIQVLESLGQPADHPVSVTCSETEYLKTFICRVF
ncbi:MAG: class I SAM-dependent rRNA methyltransferase [Planctomycetaceae bacterium]|nr:class I SAM-dependent rRNA methyltransferase [Planctomycetaceae bacterium]